MTVNTDTTPKPRMYQNAYRLQDELEDALEAANPDGEPSNEPTPEPAPATVEENAFKQRYDSLKTHYDKRVNEFNGRIAQLESQLKKSSEKLQLPASVEEIDEWRREYPDLYKIVKMIARLEADDRAKELDEKLQKVEVDGQRVKREKAEAVLLRLHPDFEELKNSKDFRQWLDEQHPVIQGWLYDNKDDPYLAGKAIDMYKAERGVTKPKREPKRDAVDASLAVGRTSKGADEGKEPKKWSLKEIQKMTPREYERNEAEIDKAFAENRVIYDM